jgi:hypothetical protein
LQSSKLGKGQKMYVEAGIAFVVLVLGFRRLLDHPVPGWLLGTGMLAIIFIVLWGQE